MTRIIAGAAKGRRLSVPADGTRPTSDRAREALFNSLSTIIDLPWARVLDLFAGTGAVGLEALSRGAVTAVFIESDRAAGDILRRNIEAVRLPGAQLVRRDVAAYLDSPEPDEPYDLVFADPPYGYANEALAAVLTAVAGPGWLAADGVLVVERSAGAEAPGWPDHIELVKHRRYGAGALWYGRPR